MTLKKKNYSLIDPAQQLRVCGVYTRNSTSGCAGFYTLNTALQGVRTLHTEQHLSVQSALTPMPKLSACSPSMLPTSSLGQRMNKQEVRENITPRRGRVPGRDKTLTQPRIAVHVYKRQNKMGSHQEVLGHKTHQRVEAEIKEGRSTRKWLSEKFPERMMVGVWAENEGEVGFYHEMFPKCCQISHLYGWNKDDFQPVKSHATLASMLPLTRRKPLYDGLCQHECGNHNNSLRVSGCWQLWEARWSPDGSRFKGCWSDFSGQRNLMKTK